MTETLADLGEAELLRRLTGFAPAGQFSDDTACLRSDERQLVVNTDVLVDGIHFSEQTTDAQDVGWRAVAANFSDLAASGAEQVEGITVALVTPGNTTWTWVEGVYQGITAALQCHGGDLLGGDCSGGQQRLLSVTALGRLGPLRLHRGDAQPGDVLLTSGGHGLSRLGLALLQRDPLLNDVALEGTLKAEALQHHQRPTPRFDALRSLIDCRPEHLPWRAGGTDSSDGLLAAVQGLCSSSGYGAVLNREQLPRPQGWPAGELWDQWCLAGGEDFELVVSLPPRWAEAWQNVMPTSHRIGSITDKTDAVIWHNDNRPVLNDGFRHYR